MQNRILRHPQGKVLGGSSAINGQAFIAPSQVEINYWETLGNRGWNWSSLVPYYRKFHTLTIPPEDTRKHLGIEWSDEEIRGKDGPIQASFTGVLQDPLSKAWVDTFKKLQYELKIDPFSGKAIGGYSCPASIDPVKKERSYAVPAYLAPAKDRPNLKVLTGSFVQKILFDQNTKASGVEVIVDGQKRAFNARKEIILAAGVFQTPKILELSGIGDEVLLQKHGLPVLVNHPHVGENLQDHLMTGISFEVNEGVPTGDPLVRQEPEAVQGAMEMYMTRKEGPFCVGGYASHSFMPILDFLDGGKAKLQSLLDEYKNTTDKASYDFVRSVLEDPEEGSGCLAMFAAQVNVHATLDKSFLQDLLPGNFTSLGVTLSHPLSRGSSHITSSDPAKDPQIDPRYFSHPLDIEVMARHTQALETLAATQPFASYLKPNGRRNHATAYVKDLQAAKDYLQTTAFSNNHPVGTCAMLPREKGGVVDTSLKVYGTQGLRVVDSSMIPLVPRANIQSTVYAVAERAADIIKQEHGLVATVA